MLEEGLFNRFGMGITDGDTFVLGQLPSTSWQSWGRLCCPRLMEPVDGSRPY